MHGTKEVTSIENSDFSRDLIYYSGNHQPSVNRVELGSPGAGSMD